MVATGRGVTYTVRRAMPDARRQLQGTTGWASQASDRVRAIPRRLGLAVSTSGGETGGWGRVVSPFGVLSMSQRTGAEARAGRELGWVGESLPPGSGQLWSGRRATRGATRGATRSGQFYSNTPP